MSVSVSSPTSPSLSTSSASSFDLVSRPSRSRTTSSDPFSDDLASDDEIVWSISESPHSLSSDSSLTASDDDFVVLSRPRSPFTRQSRSNVGGLGRNSDALVGELAKLSINPATSSSNDDMRTPIGKPSNISIPLSEGGRRSSVLTPTQSSTDLGASRTRRKAKAKGRKLVQPIPYPSPAATPTKSKLPKAVPPKITTTRKLKIKSPTSTTPSTKSPSVAAPPSITPITPPSKPAANIKPSKSSATTTVAQAKPTSSPKAASTAPPPSVKAISKKVKRTKKAKKAIKVAAPAPAAQPKGKVLTGLGERPIVEDDASESGDDTKLSVYEEAAQYISSFLTSTEPKESACKLTLLQALIVELGLSVDLPNSLTAAKAFLKSRVFMNIREYIAVRDKGQAALQRVMHPSRKALVKSIREKKNPASLKWVKQNGLQVLLVTCFH